MPRQITTSGIAAAAGTNVYYTELLNIDIPGLQSIHLTASLPTKEVGVSFVVGDIEYRSSGLTRSAVGSNTDNRIEPVSISFGNADRSFGALAESLQLRQGFVTISGAFIDPMTNTVLPETLFPIAEGNIGSISFDETSVSVQIEPPIRDISATVPRRFYGQADGFRWSVGTVGGL